MVNTNTEKRSLIYIGKGEHCHSLLEYLHSNDWFSWKTDNFDDACNIIKQEKVHVGLVELTCQHTADYLHFIESILSLHRYVEWIALVKTVSEFHPQLKQTIVESFIDFHTIPVDPPYLLASIGHAYGMGKMKWDTGNNLNDINCIDQDIIGNSQQIQNLFKSIGKVAAVSAPVLITGESGTGKEMTAQAIHRQSAVAEGPFITVNCGAIPSTLIQSELFGYEKGAFTGAHQRKIGHVEAANNGTIFLDEVGDLPLDQQINLLRFLQEGTIQRVGGSQAIPVNARVIAATHVDLEKAVRSGKLREDLFYRLNVLHITTPPLRERPGDIELLAQYFFNKFSHEKGKHVVGFAKSCFVMMRDYTWEGNVRELVNRVRHAMVMCERKFITADDLGIDRHSRHVHFMSLKQAKERAEQEAILNALARTNDNVTLAAKSLNVSRVTLYRLIEKHHIHLKT